MPLYDVISAYPYLGEGPGRLSSHKVRMAMAVRSHNAHWRMREILRRHWEAAGRRNGVVTATGEGVDAIIEEIVERTPAAVDAVAANLPDRFPARVAEPILEGLRAAAGRLALWPEFTER